MAISQPFLVIHQALYHSTLYSLNYRYAAKWTINNTNTAYSKQRRLQK